MIRIAIAILFVLSFTTQAYSYSVLYHGESFDELKAMGDVPFSRHWGEYRSWWQADTDQTAVGEIGGNAAGMSAPIEIISDSGTVESLSVALTFELSAQCSNSGALNLDNFLSEDGWMAGVDYHFGVNGATIDYAIFNDDPWADKTDTRQLTLYTHIDSNSAFSIDMDLHPFFQLSELNVDDPEVDVVRNYWITGVISMVDVQVVPEPSSITLLGGVLILLGLSRRRA